MVRTKKRQQKEQNRRKCKQLWISKTLLQLLFLVFLAKVEPEFEYNVRSLTQNEQIPKQCSSPNTSKEDPVTRNSRKYMWYVTSTEGNSRKRMCPGHLKASKHQRMHETSKVLLKLLKKAQTACRTRNLAESFLIV